MKLKFNNFIKYFDHNDDYLFIYTDRSPTVLLTKNGSDIYNEIIYEFKI